MKLPIRSRNEQFQKMQPMIAAPQATADALLDGVAVKSPTYAAHWILESHIHQTIKLSESVGTTRNFAGSNQSIVRDEIRQKTWAVHNSSDGTVVLSEIIGKRVNQKVLFTEGAWRTHIHLDKYSGTPFVTSILGKSGNTKLFFGAAEVSTSGEFIDFPCFSTDQVPIGHVPHKSPEYGVLTYKDRNTQKIYIRRFFDNSFQDERVLFEGDSAGGASLAVVGSQVIAFVMASAAGKIVPMYAVSTDKGVTFSAFDALDVPLDADIEIYPNSGGPTIDFSGVAHFPLLAGNASKTTSFDIILADQVAVESITVERGIDRLSVARHDAFPKSSSCRETIMFDSSAIPVTNDYRKGDGISDGVGIIATMLVKGRLFSSNSQSGGMSYPNKLHLNHEMLEVAAYATTQCYTRGEHPNTVSMDYIFLECIDASEPISGELHFETWDMPLPEPVLSAKLVAPDRVDVTIHKDGNFIPGKTVFSIDSPGVAILDVTITDVRLATLKLAFLHPEIEVVGLPLTFEAKSHFYHHKASTKIAK